MAEWFADSDLFRAGGWVLVSILLLSVVMWGLILERYLFLHRDLKHLAAAALNHWQQTMTADPVTNRRLREGLSSGFHAQLSRWLGSIQVIAAILPLLGLLGTVIGMIKTFEVMAVFGTGNVRGMADGISQALITTMAGLITAVGGLVFANDLEQRITRETEHMVEHLVYEPGDAAP
jgi:biopolymer transport protein ExbB